MKPLPQHSTTEHLQRWQQGARSLQELDPELVEQMQKVSRRAGVVVAALLTCAAGVGSAVISSMAGVLQ